MALAAWAAARLIHRTTGSSTGGLAAAALILANPNLLYLQSTPMTEPLLFGTTMLAVMLVAEWIDRDAPGWPHAAGLAVTAACMTRYEAWPITRGNRRPRPASPCCGAASSPMTALRAVARLGAVSGGRGHPVRAEQPLDHR